MFPSLWALLVNKPNHYAAVLRYRLCAGSLGTELGAFISPRQRYSKLDTRAAVIDLAPVTYGFSSNRHRHRNTWTIWSSYMVALESESRLEETPPVNQIYWKFVSWPMTQLK